MGTRLNALVERIRNAKGPFFVARVGLRVKFSLNNADLDDSETHQKQLIEACRSLGFDPLDPSLDAKDK